MMKMSGTPESHANWQEQKLKTSIETGSIKNQKLIGNLASVSSQAIIRSAPLLLFLKTMVKYSISVEVF
jgi:hypothetical protein